MRTIASQPEFEDSNDGAWHLAVVTTSQALRRVAGGFAKRSRLPLRECPPQLQRSGNSSRSRGRNHQYAN